MDDGRPIVVLTGFWSSGCATYRRIFRVQDGLSPVSRLTIHLGWTAGKLTSGVDDKSTCTCGDGLTFRLENGLHTAVLLHLESSLPLVQPPLHVLHVYG